MGEKAWTLSQLKQNGYPILPGFVISSATLWDFLGLLRDSESLLADFPDSSLHIDVDDYRALQMVAQESRQAIMATKLPSQWLSSFICAIETLNSPTLILRSSLGSSLSVEQKLAGLLPSQICCSTPEWFEFALKQAWGDLFSARSLFYWQRLGIGIEKLNLGILVQPITNAIASGTLEIQNNHITIQSTLGLEHSLLKGEVLPDFYQVQSLTGTIETRRLGNKTRAYRLKNELEVTKTHQSALEAYFLSEELQKQYSLDENSLTKLIEIAQSLASERQEGDCYEWTLTQTSENQEAQFYLTQFHPNLSKRATTLKSHQEDLVNKKLLMTDSHSLLTGLSAAPGVAIALTYVMTDLACDLSMIPEGRVLVTRTINLDWLPLLKKSAGIIAEEGGITSHAAIIAREIGIPAVIGIDQAIDILKTGESVLLNGNEGEIYRCRGNVEAQRFHPEREADQFPILDELIGTKLMVNLSQPSSIRNVVDLPVDGVGLLRSDLMLLELLSKQSLKEWLESSQKLYFVEQLTQLINEFATAFSPRPVFYRSLDWRISELYNSSLDRQLNPLSEQRGTYHYLLDSTLFELELQALLQVNSHQDNHVNLILPFVRSLQEFSFCRNLVEQFGLTQKKSFRLWIMAEVPSVIFLLPQYVQAGVQGIAIGTNDLTQLILGIDRKQGISPEQLNATHPAILEAIQQLIKIAKSESIPCSICGQAPGQYPELIEHLVKWGITSISVDPEAVTRTYQAINRAEKQVLLELARQRLNYN